jgi:catechol 2,3-dioxygenase-like lactoylglutathione lyase family enzyme
MNEIMKPYVDATEQLVTEIFVHDISRSKDFYRRLGFKLHEDKGSFVTLTWEGHELYLDERKDMPPHPDFPQANMRIMVPKVDDYWKLATEMGVKVLRPIENRRYGLRDFTILDPDGFGIRFGMRLSDISQE